MSDPTAEATPSTETPKPGPPPSAQNVGKETADTPVQLPDDHPLVKTLAAQKSEITALKAKVTEFEDAGKTEAEKAAEELAQARAEAADAKAAILRRDIALEHSLTKDDAALLDAVTDEDAMRSLAARLAAQVEDRTTRPPKPDPNQGRSGAAPTSTGDLFAATVSDLINR